VNELARELEELAGRLRSGELGAEEAAAAVERCAELAARLGSELDAAAREAERGDLEGQERLL
jgi:exonuclease VII small subunit